MFTCIFSGMQTRCIVLYYQIIFLTSFIVIRSVELEVFLCYDAFVITLQII